MTDPSTPVPRPSEDALEAAALTLGRPDEDGSLAPYRRQALRLLTAAYAIDAPRLRAEAAAEAAAEARAATLREVEAWLQFALPQKVDGPRGDMRGRVCVVQRDQADRDWSDAAAIEAACDLTWAGRQLSRAHATAVLHTAAEAAPVVPVPPCPTCEGGGGGAVDGVRAAGQFACPSCSGSGRDRLIPESEIRAWIESRRDDPGSSNRRRDLLALGRWLDELGA